MPNSKPRLLRQIEENEIKCDTHGSLGIDDMSLSVSGVLMCSRCSKASEATADPSIDPTVEVVL